MKKVLRLLNAFIFFLIITHDLSAQVTEIDKGLYMIGFRGPNADTATYDSIWFTRGAIIFEKKVFNSLQFDTGLYTGYDPFRYSYYDLNNCKVYDYNNFSDTAQPVCRYNFDKKCLPVYGLVRPVQVDTRRDSVKLLRDTCINSQVFKRLRYLERRPKMEYRREDIFYFSCSGYRPKNLNVNGPYEDLFPKCAIIRIDVLTYYHDTLHTGNSFYKTVRTKLSENEEKIFDRWAENAKSSTLPIIPFEDAIKIPWIPIRFRNHPIYKMMYPDF
ncbi:MAG: hypothetical protein ABIT96_00400 [Ferruginibacter sp.]